MKFFDKTNINRLYFFLILAVAVTLRVLFINRSFWSDEIFSVLGSKTSLLGLGRYLVASEAHPPCMFIALHFWMMLFSNEWGIRLLFVIFGVGSTVLMYAIGKRFVNEDFGLLAMAVYAITPFAVWNAQEVRAYVFGTFFCLVAMYYFIVMLQEKRFSVKTFILYACAAAASVYSFYFNIFIIAGCGIFLLVRFHKYTVVFSCWIVSLLLTAILLTPLYPILIGQMSLIDNHSAVLAQRGIYFMGMHVGTLMKAFYATVTELDPLFWDNTEIFAQEPFRYLYLLVGILLLVFIVTGIRRAEKRLRWRGVDLWLFVILALFPPLFAFIYEVVFRGGVVARYFVIPATLFCFVLAAIAFTAGKRRHAVMIIAVLAIFMAVRAPWIYGPKQDWKSAAQYVKKNFKRNDLVVAVFSNRLSFGYYFNIPVDLYTISNLIRKEYVKDRDVWVIDITPKNESKVAELLSRSPTIWVMFSSGQRFQEEAFIDQMLYRNDFGNVIVRRFEGVDIILYTKQQAKKVTP